MIDPLWLAKYTATYSELDDENLKLYVWKDTLCFYSCGIMFALAHSVEEARRLILATEIEQFQEFMSNSLQEDPDIYDVPVGFAVWGGS